MVSKAVQKQNEALFEAIVAGNGTLVKGAIDAGADLNAKDSIKWGVLHYCAFLCQKKLMAYFLDRNVSPNELCADKSTPLIIAASRGSAECVELLLKKRAKVDLSDRFGHTAMLGAVESGNLATVDLLIAAHADLSVKNKEGKGLLEVAREMGYGEIAAHIEKSMLETSLEKTILSKKEKLFAS